MVSPVSVLPRELQERVFCFLVNEKKAIENCRLTCSAFKEASSPFLITKVVFSKRLKAITRLQEVMEHPYFHKHITELVYDASWYDGGAAESWTEYVEACSRAPREFQNSLWAARLERDEAFFQNIWRRVATLLATQDQGPFDADDAADAWFNNEEEVQAYRLGCHESFTDYHMLSRAEERIQYANLGRLIIGDAFVKLPKLKTVLITDWRGLVKEGESYSACASRLFGNTLAPEYMDANRGEYSCFYEIASAALDIPEVRIETFAISPHPFESLHVRGLDENPAAWNANYLPPTLLKLFGKSTTHALFSKLRRLRLALEFPQSGQPTNALDMRDTLAQSSHLTHLTLCSQRPPNIDGSVVATSSSQIAALLNGWHFRHLRVLDLRHWILPEDELKTWLQRHSMTIRELRLWRCLLLYGNGKDLAMWGGSNLFLEGIELGGDLDLVPLTPQIPRTLQDILHPLTLEWEPLWLREGSNTIKREPARVLLDNSDGIPWYLKSTAHETRT